MSCSSIKDWGINIDKKSLLLTLENKWKRKRTGITHQCLSKNYKKNCKFAKYGQRLRGVVFANASSTSLAAQALKSQVFK